MWAESTCMASTLALSLNPSVNTLSSPKNKMVYTGEGRAALSHPEGQVARMLRIKSGKEGGMYCWMVAGTGTLQELPLSLS